LAENGKGGGHERGIKGTLQGYNGMTEVCDFMIAMVAES